MQAALTFLSEEPLVFAFALVCLGTAIGQVKLRGIGLGPAAVLFTALGISALADAQGTPIEVPPLIGTLGLMLFTFTLVICLVLLYMIWLKAYSFPGLAIPLLLMWLTTLAGPINISSGNSSMVLPPEMQ